MNRLPRIISLLVISLAVLLSACAPSAEPYVRPTFPEYGGEPVTVYMISSDGQALGAVETEALRNSAFLARFTLIDSNAVELALEQVAGAQRGLLDESTIAAVGNVLGAKYAISVSSSLSQTEQGGIDLFDGLVGNLGSSTRNEAQISARLTNIETGAVIAVGFGSSSQSNESANAFLEAAQRAIDEMLVGYVAQAG